VNDQVVIAGRVVAHCIISVGSSNSAALVSREGRNLGEVRSVQFEQGVSLQLLHKHVFPTTENANMFKVCFSLCPLC